MPEIMSGNEVSPGAASTPPKKKYVTRACDACKRRKSKCDGCDPCIRCINSDNDCTYNMSYNRVQRRQLLVNRQEARRQAGDTAITSLRPPESDGSERRGNEIGDASVHEFLRRVSDHLAQIGQGLPRNLLKRDGDSLDGESSSARCFMMPDQQTAAGYVECVFEHALVTYRYLNKDEVLSILDLVYAEDETTLQDHVAMAMVLLVMGMGCLWTASWRNYPLLPWRKKAYKFLQAAEARLDETRSMFPPTIRLVQAQVLKVTPPRSAIMALYSLFTTDRLTQCQLELGSGRFNSAWLTLGLAVRLGQAMDIQRERPSATAIEAHHQRNLFWTTFVIDRYLAVSLGRPMAIHENDITVTLAADLHQDVASHLNAHERKLTAGVVAHARLGRILGHIITKLYSGSRRSGAPIEQAVTELEAEIEHWLRETPTFFHPRQDAATSGQAHPESDFYDVPWVFRRQQRTVRAAFCFANMLIYRGYLLVEFLHNSPSTPRSSPVSQRVKACVHNALEMVRLAADFGVEQCKYNAAFWTTSHFLFCAISILLVYLTLYQEFDDRMTIEAAIAKAMDVHRNLDCSSNINTQRLLEESRSRAHTVRQMVPLAAEQPPPPTNEDHGQDQTRASSSEFDASTAVEAAQINEEGVFPVQDGSLFHDVMMDGTSLGPFATTGDFDMIMDLGFDNTSFSFPQLVGEGDNHEFPFQET